MKDLETKGGNFKIMKFQNIANPDYISLMLLGFIVHKDDPEGTREKARLYRRVVARYINLAIIETLRFVSLKTANRFKTYDDLVASGMLILEKPYLFDTYFNPNNIGLLSSKEKHILENIQKRTDKPLKWIPLVWSINLLNKMRQEKFLGKGPLTGLFHLKSSIKFNLFR